MKYLLLILCLTGTPLWSASVGELVTQLLDTEYAHQESLRNELFTQLAAAPSGENLASGSSAALLTEVYRGIRSNAPASTRTFLIELLQNFGTEASVPELYPLLGDPDPLIRERARLALVAIPGEEAGVALINGLKRSPKEERIAYIQALAERGESSAWQEIAGQLDATDPELQATEAWALGVLGQAEALPRLWAAHEDATGSFRLILETALLQIGLNAVAAEELAQRGTLSSVRIGAFQQLHQLDAAAAAALLEACLTQTNSSTRADYLIAAMETGDTNLIKRLVDAAPSLSQAEQKMLISTIWDQRLTQHEALLIQFLQGADPVLANAAAEALGWVGGASSFQPLYQFSLKHPDNAIVMAAISQLNAPGVDAKLLAAAKDTSHPEAAITALQTIATRFNEASVQFINQALLDPAYPQAWKETALQTLEKVGDLESIQNMIQLAKGSDSLARTALKSLKRLSISYAVPELQWKEAYHPALEATQSSSEKINLFLILDAVPTQDALDYLMQHVQEPTYKATVLKTLQRWPRYEVAAAWIKFSADPNASPQDRETAVQGLKRTFSSKSMEGSPRDRAKMAAEVLPLTQSKEEKRAIAAGVATNFPPWMKQPIANEMKPFKDDPDIMDLLAPLF